MMATGEYFGSFSWKEIKKNLRKDDCTAEFYAKHLTALRSAFEKVFEDASYLRFSGLWRLPYGVWLLCQSVWLADKAIISITKISRDGKYDDYGELLDSMFIVYTKASFLFDRSTRINKIVIHIGRLLSYISYNNKKGELDFDIRPDIKACLILHEVRHGGEKICADNPVLWELQKNLNLTIERGRSKDASFVAKYISASVKGKALSAYYSTLAKELVVK